MKKIFYLTFFCIVLFFEQVIAQPISSDTSKFKQKVFGNIYTGFYYRLNKNITPRQAFELSTALFGYQAEMGEKVRATLIYDVSRTTDDISVSDTSGQLMNVSYHKGSDYTAFLKQAQIDWSFAKDFELSAGQLLNQQYLTLQDKFWGYRYIVYTFQERYRFGSPADFGARISWNRKDKINFSIGVVNGDGAFNRQDSKGLMLYHTNLEIFPVKNLTVKFYFNICPDNNLPASMVYSAFVGYKADKWKLGAEYNQVTHPDFSSGKTYSGYSVYCSYKISEKTDILLRYDLIENSAYYKNNQYIIAGIQYLPVKNFFISINGRYLLPEDEPQVYINTGIKF